MIFHGQYGCRGIFSCMLWCTLNITQCYAGTKANMACLQFFAVKCDFELNNRPGGFDPKKLRRDYGNEFILPAETLSFQNSKKCTFIIVLSCSNQPRCSILTLSPHISYHQPAHIHARVSSHSSNLIQKPRVVYEAIICYPMSIDLHTVLPFVS